LAHPNAPRDWSGHVIGHPTAGSLERQLHLTVMVALVPKHVLEEEDRVVVVQVHVPACLYSALHRVPHGLGAVVEDLRNAVRVTLVHPLFVGHVSGEFWRVLEDQHKPHIMDVREHLRDGWASFHRPGLQPAGRARRKLIRMVLFRSQESNSVSSKPRSGAPYISTLRSLQRKL